MESPTFIKNSALDILVPQDSVYDIEKLIESSNTNEQVESGACKLFPFVAARKMLHFDEAISICVVLRTLYCNEPKLKSYISRLTIGVEAHAFSSSNPLQGQEASKDQSPSQSRDIIWSTTVDTTEEPVIIVQQKDSGDENPQVYIVWKVLAYLTRPRFRLQSPMIIFKSFATKRAEISTDTDHSDDKFLSSGIPVSLNIFESLAGDQISQGLQPRLSALRLAHISSTAQSPKPTEQTLKSLLPAAYPAIPALSAKVRYSSLTSLASRSTLIASLEIETAPFFNNDVIITDIGMQLLGGSAQDLNTAGGLKLPIRCRPKDNPIFLYRLNPTERGFDGPGTNQTSRVLEIMVDAEVVVSEKCRPRIEMRWKTGVDFSVALNPSYGAPGQSLQRNKRPSSLPVPLTTSNNGNISTLTQESELVKAESNSSQQQAILTSNLGIAITFTAPQEVRLGQPFSWDVFIVNRSSKPRKLMITAIPKRRRGDLKGHFSKASSSSISGHKANAKADAVMDENRLYAIQRNAGNDNPQIEALSTEVKVGPLNPGFCHHTVLKFLPLAHGVLHIEAIRVVDMASEQFVDIQDLPDIIATEGVADK